MSARTSTGAWRWDGAALVPDTQLAAHTTALSDTPETEEAGVRS